MSENMIQFGAGGWFPESRVLDLRTLPSGRRYEDQYGAWLEVIRRVAEAPEQMAVMGAPRSWVSLLYYLGAYIDGFSTHFPEDQFITAPVEYAVEAEKNGRLRELVEWHASMRPELVDALYKSDVQWKVTTRRHQWQREFKVTCNGSFFRPEVLKYLHEDLPKYRPQKPKCVIVPCAADKPYPADLHKAVRAHIPDDYEILIGTGVLGIVPEALWDIMPLYDSGMPYEWRLMRQVTIFFAYHWYERVVVYSDFYNTAIKKGLDEAAYGQGRPLPYHFVNPIIEYKEYLNLLDPDRLAQLRAACI